MMVVKETSNLSTLVSTLRLKFQQSKAELTDSDIESAIQSAGLDTAMLFTFSQLINQKSLIRSQFLSLSTQLKSH